MGSALHLLAPWLPPNKSHHSFSLVGLDILILLLGMKLNPAASP